MGWFRRRRKRHPKVETSLGTFEFTGDCWLVSHVDTPLGPMALIVVNEQFSPGVVPDAARLIEDLPSFHKKALTYARAEDPGLLSEYGKVTPASLDITDLAEHSFAIEYGFERWDDGSMTVVFREGEPVELWLGD